MADFIIDILLGSPSAEVRNVNVLVEAPMGAPSGSSGYLAMRGVQEEWQSSQDPGKGFPDCFESQVTIERSAHFSLYFCHSQPKLMKLGSYSSLFNYYILCLHLLLTKAAGIC